MHNEFAGWLSGAAHDELTRALQAGEVVWAVESGKYGHAHNSTVAVEELRKTLADEPLFIRFFCIGP